MLITDLDNSKLDELKLIHDKEKLYPFHDLKNPLYCVKKAIIEDDKLIGACAVRLTSETSLIMDPDVSRLVRARALRNTFSILYDYLKGFGLDDTHVFVTPADNHYYANFLKKNFGFVDATGIPLYKQYPQGE